MDKTLSEQPAPDEINLSDIEGAAVSAGDKFRELIAQHLLEETEGDGGGGLLPNLWEAVEGKKTADSAANTREKDVVNVSGKIMNHVLHSPFAYLTGSTFNPPNCRST